MDITTYAKVHKRSFGLGYCPHQPRTEILLLLGHNTAALGHLGALLPSIHRFTIINLSMHPSIHPQVTLIKSDPNTEGGLWRGRTPPPPVRTLRFGFL